MTGISEIVIITEHCLVEASVKVAVMRMVEAGVTVVGVPLIMPVELLKLSPAGKVPEVMA